MADQCLCSIDACGKPSRRAGLCASHYHRKLRYGNPLGGGAFRRKPEAECIVDGCSRPGYSFDLCKVHYHRFKRHGDPLSGSTRKGEVTRFVRDIVPSFESDDCLNWPFSCAGPNRDRPQFWLDGEKYIVARYVCLEAHGCAPTHDHEAAHSCGNSICVNKRHLRWATHAENELDKLAHGTRLRGEGIKTSRLTEQSIIEIRKLHQFLTNRELADAFGTSPSNIARIVSRKAWAHVE